MPKGKLAVAALLLLSGPVVIAFGVPNLLEAWASAGWPTAKGQVLVSEVVSTRGRMNSTGYRPRVAYAYSVDGREYKGERISHADEVAKSRQHAQQIAAAYPPAASVTVAYDPDDPAASVLEPGFTAGALAVPGFGLALSAAGGAILVLERRRAT